MVDKTTTIIAPQFFVLTMYVCHSLLIIIRVKYCKHLKDCYRTSIILILIYVYYILIELQNLVSK